MFERNSWTKNLFVLLSSSLFNGSTSLVYIIHVYVFIHPQISGPSPSSGPFPSGVVNYSISLRLSTLSVMRGTALLLMGGPVLIKNGTMVAVFLSATFEKKIPKTLSHEPPMSFIILDDFFIDFLGNHKCSITVMRQLRPFLQLSWRKTLTHETVFSRQVSAVETTQLTDTRQHP